MNKKQKKMVKSHYLLYREKEMICDPVDEGE
jgi:hypothetical protein